MLKIFNKCKIKVRDNRNYEGAHFVEQFGNKSITKSR